ncbi:putative short-chain dehydrogenase [Phaeomoniella chlamydospora]|uniref:Putative short-chain dehydrogenase n=1 Tax=Phaeomoniella chlamydospora TaxID=158046 RepID=A0A0G2G0J1_PHACM|nr:putative short-chain dehydrogenase [Phaeomoniella chlamydospora]
MHNVVLVSRDGAALEKIKSKYPSQVQVVPGDLSDFTLPSKAVEVAKSSFGGLDGLIVNHAVLGQVAKIAEADPEKWRGAFDVNVFSAIACVQAALPELRKSKGCILLTSSGAAVKGTPSWGSYGASKACLNHLALTLQAEEPNITTMAIRPGQVDTEMQRDIREKHRDEMDHKVWSTYFNAHKEGKLLRPDQPGNVMARLVLDPPRDLNGKFIK